MPMIKTLGKLDKELFSEEYGDLQTDEVIITNERFAHISKHHPEDVYAEIKNSVLTCYRIREKKLKKLIKKNKLLYKNI